MASHLSNLPFVHDKNLVCILNGRQPVRDDDRSASPHQPGYGFPNFQLSVGIHARSGFIENEIFGIVREGPCERDQLLLPC